MGDVTGPFGERTRQILKKLFNFQLQKSYARLRLVLILPLVIGSVTDLQYSHDSTKMSCAPFVRGLMIMFDAGLQEGKVGLCVVAMLANGEFVGAVAEPCQGVQDPIYARALARALRMAIDFPAQLNLGEVTIMGDSLILIPMVRDMHETPILYETLLQEIRKFLCMLNLDKLCWVKRDQNILAHTLANFAKNSLAVKTVWDTPLIFLFQTTLDVISSNTNGF